MLLLTHILRPRYRGVIYLPPAGDDSPPEIEFSDGEGPEQVMNQIQELTVPEIRKHVEPMGPYLRWQELDLDARRVRRHRTPFHDRLEFVLCPDEMGLELILSTAGEPGVDSGRARPWVPLRRLAEPGEEQLATIGWPVAAPEFQWRYLKTRYAPPAIELTWSCANLPGHWAARVLRRIGHLDCRFGDGERCVMNPTRDGLLVYRGFHRLPEDSEKPAAIPIRLDQPLVVAGPDSVSPARHELATTVPATVEALDFRAAIDGRPTRLVARADLERPFAAEVLTAEDVLLPDAIPAGAIPGLPWPLAVTPAGLADDDGGGSADEGLGRRRWRLVPEGPAPDAGDRAGKGRWRQVTWQGDPPSVAFGLGSFDAASAPRITRIEHRRASVGWRVEASDDGRRLCLCTPHWLPVGCPGQVALPVRSAGNGFDYGARVRTRLDGLEERFAIDQRSELPANRLFLDPRRWRFRDQEGGEAIDGEALGEGGGGVYWRHPRAGDGGGNGRPELKPTDWAGGSAPVLLLPKDSDHPLRWGALHAPRPVPWDALEELAAEPTPDPREVLLVPGARPESPAPAIWIDLWGFVCRYDAHRTAFSRSTGETGEPTAWIAGKGLQLFPARGGYLLRSFAPIYAVRDPEPGVFRLRASQPRPTLHVGRELDARLGSLTLEIGSDTFVRHQLTAPGEVPTTFEPGRVPGTRLRLGGVADRVVWLAVEQRRGDAGRRAGYLLTWDAAAGWRFRGFFVHPGAAVELGVIRRAETWRRVFLGGEGTSRVSSFRLTLDRRGIRWSETAPAAVVRATTPAMIRAWESHHFAPERRPAPLDDFGLRVLQPSRADEPWIFELFDSASRAEGDLPAGIRVWQAHAGAGDDLDEGARELGEDPAIETAAAPPAPEKRILRADDDDDF